MFGLSSREMRFAFVISVSHLAQHFLARLLPPLIPVLAVALAYPLWQLGLLVGLYSFGSGLAQAPLGVLSDKYDRLYILPTGIAVAGAAYLLFAVAPLVGAGIPALFVLGTTFDGGFLVMCVAMVGVGLGAAVTHPTGYPLITDNVREENKGKVLGAFGSAAKFGDAAAPAAIGVLLLVLVWSRILILLGLLGVVVGIGLYLALRSDEFDTIPAAQAAVDTTDEHADTGGVATSEDVPETDRRSYLYPMTVIYVFFVTKMFAGHGLNAFVPAFIVGVYAYSFDILSVSFGSESVANFYFSALLLSAGVSQLFIGGVADTYDARMVMLACLGVATVGLFALGAIGLTPILLLVVVVAVGAGLWGLNPARDALISEITPPEREGRTFGYIWTAVSLTGSVIPVIVGYIMETVGMREGFMALAIGTLLAFVSISLLYTERVYVERPKPSVAAETD